MRTGETLTEPTSSPPSLQQHSPWHSPVPYLFGGLAAMLGLIAFALLILACSYWKLSGYLDGGDSSSERDLESGGEQKGSGGEEGKRAQEYEEKILVIMPGQVKPTVLATPISSRSSSFGDANCSCEKKERTPEKVSEKEGSGGGDQVRSGSMEAREASDQVP